MKFRAINLDPPWPETKIGRFKSHSRPDELPYPVMSIEQIAALPVHDLAEDNCHIWLWTTNRSLPDGFDLLKKWGFKYLAPIHWIKPSGFGAWFIHRSQTLLFGYRGKLEMKARYKPNVLFANSRKHSQKPQSSYELIEAVSHGPYLELFARHKQNDLWTVAGNEIDGQDIHESLKRLILA